MAALASLLLVFALAALILLLPLKTTTVELYTLDRQTGASSASPPSARTSGRLRGARSLADCVYVKRREGATISPFSRYRETQMFDGDEVDKEYLDWFNSPDALDARFSRRPMWWRWKSSQRTVRGHRLQHGGRCCASSARFERSRTTPKR
ncbi:VirB8/TrbF family protein [Escherichia coli]